MPGISERSSLLRNGDAPLQGGYEGFGGVDDNIVMWDGDDDPANPMNWTERKKWSQVTIVAVFTFLV
jgi:hypothetical protein